MTARTDSLEKKELNTSGKIVELWSTSGTYKIYYFNIEFVGNYFLKNLYVFQIYWEGQLILFQLRCHNYRHPI